MVRILVCVALLLTLAAASQANEGLLKRRSATFESIERLLRVVSPKDDAPPLLVAAVNGARAALGQSSETYVPLTGDREIAGYAFAMAGRKRQLDELLERFNSKEQREEFGTDLRSIVLEGLLAGKQFTLATDLVESLANEEAKDDILRKIYIEMLIRGSQESQHFFHSYIPLEERANLRKEYSDNIHRRKLEEIFTSRYGVQWLQAMPWDLAFLDTSAKPRSEASNAACIAYRKLLAGERVPAECISSMESNTDFQKLAVFFELQSHGCAAFQKSLTFGNESGPEFKAKYAALISCDFETAGTLVGSLKDTKRLTTAITLLGVYARNNLSDTEIVAYSKVIDTDLNRLYFLCSTIP